MDYLHKPPAAIEAIVAQASESMSDTDRRFLREHRSGSPELRRTIERCISNAIEKLGANSFWRTDAAVTYRIDQPDDTGCLILCWVFATVQGWDFDAHAQCAEFRRHQAETGQPPLEAGGWNDTERSRSHEH